MLIVSYIITEFYYFVLLPALSSVGLRSTGVLIVGLLGMPSLLGVRYYDG